MPVVQFGGLSSGIDTKGIIDGLMNVERAPLQRLQAARGALTTRKDAYGKVSIALNDLLAKLRAFTVTDAASARSATSSDPTAFTASAATSAVLAQYTVNVDRLATATKATSQAAIGTAITDATATGLMSSLPLPGTVTAGNVSVVVNGTLVTAAIGDPTTTSLKSALDSIAAAIQTKIRTTDAAATVTSSIVGNKVRFTLSGATASHNIRFGAAGDTSNALTIFGLSGVQNAAFSNASPADGVGLLGVVRTTGTLDSAGLTGLTSTATGTLTINGVAIAYDTTVDSLSAVVSRINASSAGVVASIDRTNDRIVVARRDTGALAMNIVDTAGTLGAALKLAPGTTNAQTIGQSAQVTIDGTKVVTSDSNRVTTAIDGVTIELLNQTTTAKSLTIGADRAAVKAALNNLVTSFNALGDTLDKYTVRAKGGPAAPLEVDVAMRTLFLDLRNAATSTATGFTGAFTTLASIGVSTGVVGAQLGTTKRFSLDEAKFNAAMDSDPTRVAALLREVTGVLQPVIAKITPFTDVNGRIAASQTSLDSQIRLMTDREKDLESRLALKRAALERKFASLEATMSQLQSQQSALGQQVSQFTRRA